MIYKEGYCFLNAYINRSNHYCDKKLKYVIGSVSFNGFCEYGGVDWDITAFRKKHDTKSLHWDAHAWLEDDDGRIYDYIFPHYNYSAEVNTGEQLKVPNGTLWEGIAKDDAASLGVCFYPASKKTQFAILLSLAIWLYKTKEDIANGSAKWIVNMD